MEITRAKKIKELMEYRRLPQLIEMGNGKPDEVFYNQLILLQEHIYDLDHVLERGWEVDHKALEHSWDVIKEDLVNLSVAEEDIEDYLSLIKTYEIHELGIREDKLPTAINMMYFYYFKSCDVKLLRRLIYDRYADLEHSIPQASWMTFDLITEVNDDVEDITEDFSTINGNMFLISAICNGSEPTRILYEDFLDTVLAQGRARNESDIDMVNDLVQVEYKSTFAMIADMLQKAEDMDLSTALIYPYIAK